MSAEIRRIAMFGYSFNFGSYQREVCIKAQLTKIKPHFPLPPSHNSETEQSQSVFNIRQYCTNYIDWLLVQSRSFSPSLFPNSAYLVCELRRVRRTPVS